MRAPQPVIVDQAAVDWHLWGHACRADESRIRWKLLVAGECTDTVDIVTGIAEIPPGARLPLHHHEPEETYYVVSGHGQIEIGDRTTEVGPGRTPSRAALVARILCGASNSIVQSNGQ